MAVADELGDKFVEVGRENVNDFRDDLACRALLLDGMPGSDDVAVAQVKARAADGDLARFLRCARVLRVLENADGGLFRAIECGL